MISKAFVRATRPSFYYGDQLITGVNASSCRKKFTGNFSYFSQYLGQNIVFFYSSFLRRDREAYANNPSYR